MNKWLESKNIKSSRVSAILNRGVPVSGDHTSELQNFDYNENSNFREGFLSLNRTLELKGNIQPKEEPIFDKHHRTLLFLFCDNSMRAARHSGSQEIDIRYPHLH